MNRKIISPVQRGLTEKLVNYERIDELARWLFPYYLKTVEKKSIKNQLISYSFRHKAFIVVGSS